MTKVERMETSEVVEQVIEVQDDSIASSICSRSLLPLELDVTYCSCCNAPFNEDIEANGPFWQGPCNYCFMPRPAIFKERDNAEVVTLIPLELWDNKYHVILFLLWSLKNEVQSSSEKIKTLFSNNIVWSRPELKFSKLNCNLILIRSLICRVVDNVDFLNVIIEQ